MNKNLIAVALSALISQNADAGRWLDMQVLSESAQYLPTHAHRGREYLAATPGEAFTVVLSNRSSERLMAVLSVDGINAITGQTAAANQNGYVLEPYQTIYIEGWRKSMQESARFYFTEARHSYGARTGRPNNLGVIGAAVFREAVPYYRNELPSIGQRSQEYEGRSADAKRAAPSAAEPLASAPLGTGHGERQYDPVRETHFEQRSYAPDEVVELRYDRYETLLAQGIIPRYQYRYGHPQEPQAFPSSYGFVPDPRSFRR